MADEIKIRFTGDTSGLNAALAQARQATAAFAPGVTGQAKASLDGLGASVAQARAASLSLAESGRDLAAAMVTARSGADGLAPTLVDAGAASRQIGTSFADVAREAIGFSAAIGDIGGRNRTMAGLVLDAAAAFRDYAVNAAYAQRGTEMFTVANDGAVAAVGRVILAVREQPETMKSVASVLNLLRLGFTSLDDVQVKAIAAAGAIDAFAGAMAGAGQVDRGYLLDLTAQLEKIPGVTDEVASSLVTAMAALPDFSVAATDRLTQFLQSFAKDADQAKALLKGLSDAVADTEHGGERLGAVFAQIQNVQGRTAMAADFARKIEPTQAVAMYERIERSLKDARAVIDEQDASQRRLLATLNLEDDAEAEAARHIGEQLDLDEKRTAQLNAQIISLGAQRLGYAQISAEMQKQKDYAEAVEKASTPSSRIAAAEANREKLQGGGRKEVGDVSAEDRELAIRTAVIEAGNQGVEGMVDVLNVMKNRLAATYGDYGDTLGAVIRKRRQFSGVDDPDGSFDAEKAKTVDAASAAYQRAKAAFDRVFGDDAGDDTVGGATHYYNPKLAAPAWGAGMANRQTRGDHVFGNPDGRPVASEQQDTVAKEAIAQENTLIREQNALKEGGTAEERQAADQAKTNLTAARDEVAEAQRLVETRRKAAAEAKDGTPQERARAAKAVTEAEQGLLDKQRAGREAAMGLEIAQAQEGSDAKKRLELDLATYRQARWVQGTAQWEEQEKAKVEITARYAKQTAADAAEAENVRFDAVNRGLKEEIERAKEAARLRGATAEESLSQQLAIQARQVEAERAHYQALQRIYADQPAQYRKVTQQLEQVDARSLQVRQQSERAYLAEIQQTYRQTFEQVGSSISSSIMGMIQGTTTFKQAAIGVAREILQMFIQSRIRMVADWLAGEAAKTQATVVGETAKTTAVQTGEAARTGFISLGAVTQAASVGAGMIKSILGSAAETFAGIFGFLSPVMGPAAVGPAVAGQAAVAAVVSAVPSFDIGAWSLPSDMLAQVHAGEMIVPAGPAAMMRAAAGGQGGGPAGGSPIHQHTHFNVTAMDSRDVRRFFGDNAKHIITAINDGMRSGSHLGMGKLRASL